MTAPAVRITAVPRTGHPNSGLHAMHFAAIHGDDVWAIPAPGGYVGSSRRVRFFAFDREAFKRVLPMRAIRWMFLAWLFARSVVRPSAIYLVHSFIFALPLFILKRRYYIFIHGSDRRFLDSRWGRAIARGAQGVFGVGFGIRESGLTVREIPNIFIPAAAAAAGDVQNDILFVLRNAPVKNPLYPIELAEALCERLDLSIEAVGISAGELPEAERERLLRLQERGCRIRYLGRKPYDDVVQRMHSSRILMIPSFAEGVPKVLLEAMSLGMQVAANRSLDLPAPLAAWVEPFDLQNWDSVARMIEQSRAAGRSQERIELARQYLAQSEQALQSLYDGIYKQPVGAVPPQTGKAGTAA